MSNRVVALSVAALLCLSGQALAQNSGGATTKPTKIVEPKKDEKKKEKITLKVGDKAPAITVDKWVKGDEVKSFEKGKVYVVEFWATWCGPCKASIPHLTEMAHKYKDIAFLGVASSEHAPDTKNDPDDKAGKRLETLSTFVKDQGDKMDYRVAFDSKHTMGTEWIAAAGRNGIPCAFIVNAEGKIAWIGHPNDPDDPIDTQLAKVAPKAEKKVEKKEEKKPEKK